MKIYFSLIKAGERGTRREREEAAVGEVVREVFGSTARREHDQSGAPFIVVDGERREVKISLSHSMHYAVMATMDKESVFGIDIEEERSQLRRVIARILTARELEYYSTLRDGFLKAWTLKEALFKACRSLVDEEIDYTHQLQLPLSGEDYGRFVSKDGAEVMRFECRHRELTDPVRALLSIVIRQL